MATKYHNRKTLYNGIQFDSRKEADRYQELLLLERAGLIRSIKLQPRYDLVVNGQKLGFYHTVHYSPKVCMLASSTWKTSTT